MVHRMTYMLPKFEFYETGSQIRRSSKSIRSNIVEGYSRRRYKSDFLRFLIYAHASVQETIDHLETLHESGSLVDQNIYESIWGVLDECGRKLNKFIKGVEQKY